MNEWTKNEWMNKWMNEWTNECELNSTKRTSTGLFSSAVPSSTMAW